MSSTFSYRFVQKMVQQSRKNSAQFMVDQNRSKTVLEDKTKAEEKLYDEILKNI